MVTFHNITEEYLDKNHSSTHNKLLSPNALNKFYVAVTRAKFASALVVPDNFNNQYIDLPFWRQYLYVKILENKIK